MGDAPERIWAKGLQVDYDMTRWSISKWNGGVEYVRSDIHDALKERADALADAHEKAIRWLRTYGAEVHKEQEALAAYRNGDDGQ